ncbi:UNVERIFIED_CONTAM: hypothetical protein GTU68_050698, partial [Idotea baltica]|nr:hypothetical protein [Idotea baltica]
GKLAIEPTKACETAADLSLAYSPGVAEPCRRIHENPELVYQYTGKGNLVAVITDGTAVLGLGAIGPEASKPVMEGKAVLFKIFADINVFDLELKVESVDAFIAAVKALEPTFGGINLEDIKSPECFEIEERLKAEMNIPVFHDDQHGTAIIASAALLNAIELTGRDVAQTKLVVSGAGAAAISCARLLLKLGIQKKNVIMCDSRGVIYRERKEGMNAFKEEFAADTDCRTLAEALTGADVFFGLSGPGVLKPEMLAVMNEKPIVFAMANPDPEIDYDVAKSARPDVIMATGRSDFPNQVNNVLGFPFIFRGALDVRASGINDEMKLAAVRALAELAKESVPEGEYLIPKPFDPRVLYTVAPAVAQAAVDSGVARQDIDIADYRLHLKGKQNQGREILRGYYGLAKSSKAKRIVFPEGGNDKVITAAVMAKQEGIAEPVLLGGPDYIARRAAALDVDISGLEIREPAKDELYEKLVEAYWNRMRRDGVTLVEARRNMRREHMFANMMLREGDADGIICGVDRYFGAMVQPILEVVGLADGVKTAAGLYLVSIGSKLLFCADTAITTKMTSERLADIAVMTTQFAESMGVEPRVAMLSYSSFGSVDSESARMVRKATELAKDRLPETAIDGEMQVDVAINEQIREETFPFANLRGEANVLIFPDMQSGNISYKLLQRIAGARVVGPIILGLKAPAYVMQRHASVDEIFNMTTVAAARASIRAK